MTEPIGLHLTGSTETGYSTEITFGGQVAASSGGEFDLLIESGDRVDRAEIRGWRAQQAVQDGQRLTLTGTTSLPLFTTNLQVTVTYEAVTPHVIKKTIRLYQKAIPRLFIRLQSHIAPPVTPERYWSFDSADHTGGPAYGTLGADVYPAVGYVLPGERVVGLLTASGWENGWSRFGYRRSPVGNLPAVALVDPAILRTATAEERAAGRHGVSLTLGEEYPHQAIPLESANDEAGDYRFLARRGYRYTLVLERRLAGSIGVELRAGDGQVFHSEAFPVKEEAWNLGQTNWQPFVFHTPAIPENGEVILHISGAPAVELRGARLFEIPPEPRPWHDLIQGQPLEWTLFVFIEDMEPTIHNLRLRSQTSLADGLGFRGSEIEKVLYADAAMLTWVTEPGLEAPIVVPSIYYFEMYFRDVFWILNGIYNKELNENILRRVGETISADGNIGNIITAYHGSIEYTHNELAYLFLIWSFLNRKRYGSRPDMEKVRRVVDFCRRTFDQEGNGIVLVNNPQSCMDVVWQDRRCRFAVSQGYYAVVLRVAKELGVDIPEDLIAAAEEAYRAFYADYGKEGAYFHAFPDNRLGEDGNPLGMISHVDFEPEFLSLYLFGRSLLSPEIVIPTLEKYPVSPEGLMPLFCRADGGFFTRDCHPFSGSLFWEGGTYINGGSWLRQQYITLAVGKYHGWEKADDIMRRRLGAELIYDWDNPLSREFLACNGNPQDSAFHRVFGWNVFVLSVNEWLGWRKPEWDPGFE